MVVVVGIAVGAGADDEEDGEAVLNERLDRNRGV